MESKTRRIILRTMEPADTQALFLMENDPDNWQYTRDGQAPYTLLQIEHFVATAPRDLATDGQLRFMIEQVDGQLVGAIDLYDYSVDEGVAWVAVMVYPREFRGRGVARLALEELIGLAASLGLSELRAEVAADNCASRALFVAAGFRSVDGVGDVLSRVVLAEHLAVGGRGERVAEQYLLGEGFRVVERNWRSSTRGLRSAARYGEIDLVASRDGALWFVEVKTRTGDVLEGDYSPQTAFSDAKISRLRTISEHYLRESDFCGEVFHLLVLVNILGNGRPLVRCFPVNL